MHFRDQPLLAVIVWKLYPPSCWTRAWITARATRPFGLWVRSATGALLPVLESLFTGDIPARGSWDGSLSQYEMQKAIKLIKSGFNLTHWAWRFNMDMG